METSACILCDYVEEDELVFGKLIQSNGIKVHHYCLLFAPGLSQRGADDEGILGFLIDDIRQEARRVGSLKCTYCKKPKANLGCSVNSCPKAYHIDCGLEFDASFEFTDTFPTFCARHSTITHPKQVKSKSCGICLEKIKERKAIAVPCCHNLIHKDCLQKFANTSGVFFKCPLCNDKETCKEMLPRMGIFLPEKDADWEMDYLEEIEQDETPEKICEADNCKSFSSFNESPWLWKLCSTCGASAIHLRCINSDEFTCKSCSEILNKPKPEEPKIEDSQVKDSPIKQPETKKRKYTPWFSDDEQFDSDQENKKETPRPKRKTKTPSRFQPQSKSLRLDLRSSSTMRNKLRPRSYQSK